MILSSGKLVQYVHGPGDVMFVVLAEDTDSDAPAATIIVGGKRQELPAFRDGRGLVMVPDFDTVEAAGLDGTVGDVTWSDIIKAESAQRSAAKAVETAMQTMLYFGIRPDTARQVILRALD